MDDGVKQENGIKQIHVRRVSYSFIHSFRPTDQLLAALQRGRQL